MFFRGTKTPAPSFPYHRVGLSCLTNASPIHGLFPFSGGPFRLEEVISFASLPLSLSAFRCGLDFCKIDYAGTVEKFPLYLPMFLWVLDFHDRVYQRTLERSCATHCLLWLSVLQFWSAMNIAENYNDIHFLRLNVGTEVKGKYYSCFPHKRQQWLSTFNITQM